MNKVTSDLKDFLDEKVEKYNNPGFIVSDPISIPHQYTSKEDIEISGFLTATISWGGRKTIIQNALKIMDLMGTSPHDFILSHQTHDLERFDGFIHRTFNQIDLVYFIKALKHIYVNEGGLEDVFARSATEFSTQPAIHEFKKLFFSINHPDRTTKHISDPAKGSAAKRLNMFLRWMVRNDEKGVDFGIWKKLSPSQLICPLDVHSARVARKLGLLERKSNDSQAAKELTLALKKFDKNDPVKYDFALFGLGVFEQF